MPCGHGADQPGCQGVNRCLFTVHQKEVMLQGQADDPRARLEVPKREELDHLKRLGDGPIMLKELALTTPDAPLIFAASQSVTTPK